MGIDKDTRFECEIFFLLDNKSAKKFKSGQIKIKGIKSKITIVNYIPFAVKSKIFYSFEYAINRIAQYFYLFLKFKRNSIFYLDRENLLLGNLLNLKNGIIIYRFMGMTKKLYDIIFYKKNLISKLFVNAIKLKDKIIISTNDGSWAEIMKKKLHEKNFYLFFNGNDFKTKKYLPSKNKKLKILYSSRIEPGKGHFELLEILFLLKKNKVDFLVTIIGNGSLKSQIIKKIESLNLKKNVKFTGNIESKKVEKYLENTDLFISINFFGVFGNNYIEAASKGVPIIALDNELVSKKYKKYFYKIKDYNFRKTANFIYTINDYNFRKTANFITRFSKNIKLRKKYSTMSVNFFNKYIVSWDQRIKKELNLLNYAYEKKYSDPTKINLN